MNRMGSRKTDLRWAVAAALVMLAVLAPSASAQFTCGNAEDRVAPYCLNTPGTPAPPPIPVRPLNFENKTSTEEPNERTSCGDGTPRFGASQWMVIYPHSPGSSPASCSGPTTPASSSRTWPPGSSSAADDSEDQGGRYDSESIGVRGLEAGKAYLIQVAGQSRRFDEPERGTFVFGGGFVPDRDGDDDR